MASRLAISMAANLRLEILENCFRQVGQERQHHLTFGKHEICKVQTQCEWQKIAYPENAPYEWDDGRENGPEDPIYQIKREADRAPDDSLIGMNPGEPAVLHVGNENDDRHQEPEYVTQCADQLIVICLRANSSQVASRSPWTTGTLSLMALRWRWIALSRWWSSRT
jgi:hypothetical protein